MDSTINLLLNDHELSQQRVVAHFKAGETIAKRGDRMGCLYWIVLGECQYQVLLPGSNSVADEWTRRVGQCVAEESALADQPVRATITAKTDVECIGLTAEFIAALGQVNPEKALQLLTPVADLVCKKTRKIFKKIIQEERPMPALKRADGVFKGKRQVVQQMDFEQLCDDNLKAVDFFASFDAEDRELLLAKGCFLALKKNQLLYEEGSTDGEVFVVLSGALQTAFDRNGQPLKLTVAGPGKKIGFVSFLDHKPSLSMCLAREETLLFCLSEKNLEAIAKENRLLAAMVYLRFLRYLIQTAWGFEMHYYQACSISSLLKESE